MNQEAIERRRLELVGKRVKLVYTSDQYTYIRPGDVGTIHDYDYVTLGGQPFAQVWIIWDRGGVLALIPEEGDRWEVIS